ncbi:MULTISPECIES: hypothetical protein [unclassified Plantibacter]|uniref:hypothetical protein n=1 Tax=unclassified Plantibacter TaxID=2624265 RepID=UPI003D32BD51
MVERDDSHVVVRPHSKTFRSAVVSTIVLVVPVWAVSFWLTGPDFSDAKIWVVVVGCIGLAVLACMGVLAARRKIVAGNDGFTERRFFGPTTVIRRQDIGRTILFELSDPGSSTTTAQLFVCDANDRPLLRMRSDLWSRDSIDALVAAYDGPIERPKRSLTMTELRTEHPGLLNWAERRLPFTRPEIL